MNIEFTQSELYGIAYANKINKTEETVDRTDEEYLSSIVKGWAKDYYKQLIEYKTKLALEKVELMGDEAKESLLAQLGVGDVL